MLESKLVSDLFPVEGDLTGTAANIKDRRLMLGLDFTYDAKHAANREKEWNSQLCHYKVISNGQ